MSVLYCVLGLKKVDVGKKNKREGNKSGESVGGKLARKSVTYDAAGKQKINLW